MQFYGIEDRLFEEIIFELLNRRGRNLMGTWKRN